MRVWENAVKPALALFALIGLGGVGLSASSYHDGLLGSAYWVLAIACFIISALYVLSVIIYLIAAKPEINEKLKRWSNDREIMSKAVGYVRVSLMLFMLVGSFVFLGFALYQAFNAAQSLPLVNPALILKGLAFAVASIASMTLFKVLVDGTNQHPKWRTKIAFESLVAGFCFIAAAAV